MATKQLELDDKTARDIYPGAPDGLKIVLEKTWGKDFFSQNLRDRIKSWADVCAELGKDSNRWLPFPNTSDCEEEAANAHWRITQTIKLFKKGQKCSYAPGNRQYKYFAWMEHGKHPTGLGFSRSHTDYDGTNTSVGPRLCSLSDSDATYIATVVCADDYVKYFNE